MALKPELNSSSMFSPAPSKLDDAFRAFASGMQVNEEELHRLALESQGSEEREFCFGDESNLHKCFKKCKKNPGHENFILLDDLCLDHFPEGYRHQEFLDRVHCQAALTVKIITYFKVFTSFPMKVNSCLSAATGFVLSAISVRCSETEQGEEKEQDCPTQTESSSDAHHEREVYRLTILTATHVVVKEAVAWQARIEFSYFDDSRTHKTVKSMTSPIVTNVHSDFGGDFSILTLYTEDKAIYLKLKKCLNEIHEVQLTRSPPSDWVFIVSHPHGTGKHVSFGILHSEDSDVEMGPVTGPIYPQLQEFPSVLYTTATCPGSSGARAYLWSHQKRLMIFPHSGSAGAVYNTSAIGHRYDDLLEWSKLGLRPIKPGELNDLPDPVPSAGGVM